MLERMSNQPLLTVSGLAKEFVIKGNKQKIKAVDGVSFTLNAGETLGVVGESGSGKSTLGRLVLRLLEPTAGEITFDGEKISELKPKELRAARRQMQMIFQDPFASLDPRMTIEALIREPLDIHKIGTDSERSEMVKNIVGHVGLTPDALTRYPHEFSGGQRQRISIARAIITRPKLIVADEPVSALDVSIQSQILNLMLDLRKEMNLTYIFISHDLSVIQHIADKVAVMYLGKIVEFASVEDIFSNPQHPYTQALISAVPQINPADRTNRVVLSGDIPSPAAQPSGCHFHPRCPIAVKQCSEVEPQLRSITSAEHLVSCHLATGEAK
jgi:oligopeptide/dipeptide ABC transporter ATP-binding protein